MEKIFNFFEKKTPRTKHKIIQYKKKLQGIEEE